MKEVKEERIREVKETVTHYEAADGTIFENEKECHKYETSALGVLRARVKPLMSEPKDAWTIMGGLDDHLVVAVSIESEKDEELILQWFFLEQPWYLEDPSKERKQKIVDIISQAQINKDVLIFGINCEEEYYFINSRQNIINNLMNLNKEQS